MKLKKFRKNPEKSSGGFVEQTIFDWVSLRETRVVAQNG
jgi:hypothetical protein